MTKENQKTASVAVIPAIVQFMDQINQEGVVADLPSEMQFICELLLETDQANDQETRLKMLRCLNVIRKLSNALSPFSFTEITSAANNYQDA